MIDSVAGVTNAPKVRKIRMDAPWEWLGAGWADLWRSPGVSLTYGAAFTLFSYVLAGGLYLVDQFFLILPLGAAFMLIGPMLAVGLYEASRRYESREEVTLVNVAFVGTRSPVQLAYLGFALVFAVIVWVEIAAFLFAVFYGIAPPRLDELLPELLLTSNGVAFLAIGTAIGAVLAFIVFSATAISVPLLMARDTDVVTAIVTSFEAVRVNFKPMMLWAWLIAFLTIVGIVTLFFGLVLTFPLIGHATWHAYRSLVED